MRLPGWLAPVPSCWASAAGKGQARNDVGAIVQYQASALVEVKPLETTHQ